MSFGRFGEIYPNEFLHTIFWPTRYVMHSAMIMYQSYCFILHVPYNIKGGVDRTVRVMTKGLIHKASAYVNAQDFGAETA